jgi:hypothetical protein
VQHGRLVMTVPAHAIEHRHENGHKPGTSTSKSTDGAYTNNEGKIMRGGSTNHEIVILAIFILVCALRRRKPTRTALPGTVLDPAGRPVAGRASSSIRLRRAAGPAHPGSDGGFTIALPAWGAYTCAWELSDLRRNAQAGFERGNTNLTLRLEQVSAG